MAARIHRFFNNYRNTHDADSPPSLTISYTPPSYIERYDDDKPAVEVCGPPPNSDFEPVENLFNFRCWKYNTNNYMTTDYTPSCTPVTPTTFVFAYSNDFDSHIVSNMWNYFATSEMELYYSDYANIRFDVRLEEDLQYHNNWRHVNASIQSHLPDPTLSFYNPFSGSDVLKVIEKFLNNNQAPVCGSQMNILVKRYPSETEIDEIVAKLRQHRITVIFMTSTNPPAEAGHPETLYNIATQTYGFCGFDEDKDFIEAIGNLPKGFHHYLIYQVNPQVSKQGFIVLPPFTAPNTGDYWFSISIQDHGPKDYSAKVKLSWDNSESVKSGSLGAPENSAGWYGNHLARWETLDRVVYNMTLQFEYKVDKVQTLQIRIYSKMPIDYWIPFVN